MKQRATNQPQHHPFQGRLRTSAVASSSFHLSNLFMSHTHSHEVRTQLGHGVTRAVSHAINHTHTHTSRCSLPASRLLFSVRGDVGALQNKTTTTTTTTTKNTFSYSNDAFPRIAARDIVTLLCVCVRAPVCACVFVKNKVTQQATRVWRMKTKHHPFSSPSSRRCLAFSHPALHRSFVSILAGGGARGGV